MANSLLQRINSRSDSTEAPLSLEAQEQVNRAAVANLGSAFVKALNANEGDTEDFYPLVNTMRDLAAQAYNRYGGRVAASITHIAPESNLTLADKEVVAAIKSYKEKDGAGGQVRVQATAKYPLGDLFAREVDLGMARYSSPDALFSGGNLGPDYEGNYPIASMYIYESNGATTKIDLKAENPLEEARKALGDRAFHVLQMGFSTWPEGKQLMRSTGDLYDSIIAIPIPKQDVEALRRDKPKQGGFFKRFFG